MQVYFSHSYRDIAINGYFLEHFLNAEIPLQADQKTDIWCVAKLERYLGEMNGFVSIIPRRPMEDDPGAYSLFIGQELNLARRSRVPRLLFVDDLVFERHRLDFPDDAVRFRPNAPEENSACHRDAILSFQQALETAYRPTHASRSKEATIVSSGGKTIDGAEPDVAEILKREGFSVTLLSGKRPGRGIDDIRLLETLWRSELCVFLYGERLSGTHIALAMAHAHCIPSIRLQHRKTASDCSPSLTGVIPWNSPDEMLVEFGRQVTSYKKGLVQPIEIARSSGTTAAARTVGTMVGWTRKDNLWKVADGASLVDHIHPNHIFIRDEVDRVRSEFGRSLGQARGREDALRICHLLYNGIRRHRFGYEVEAQTGEPGVQAIRTPGQIQTHKTATCIDLACFFASLLLAAVQNPLIVVMTGPKFAHALAGYRSHDEPPLSKPTLGDLRRAVVLKDAVLFEATGAVEADAPVGAETEQARHEKLLTFEDARTSATRMLLEGDVELRHLVDVREMRARRSAQNH